MLGAGEIQVFPQDLEEGLVRRHEDVALFSVDPEGQEHFHDYVEMKLDLSSTKLRTIV